MARIIDIAVAAMIFVFGGLIGASTSHTDQKAGEYIWGLSLLIFVFAIVVPYTETVLKVRSAIYIGTITIVIVLFVGKDIFYQWLVR